MSKQDEMKEAGMAVQTFRDIVVWQRAMESAERVYEITRSFPREELYGLSSQLRRAAVSVASNIAEGHGRGTTLQLIQFLRIARGSNFEVQCQLDLATRLGMHRTMPSAFAMAYATKCLECFPQLSVLFKLARRRRMLPTPKLPSLLSLLYSLFYGSHTSSL